MPQDIDKNLLAEKFEQVHGRSCEGMVQAPGRVNLIGEHTDYNDGFVLPIAIERRTAAAFARRHDRKITFASAQADESAQIELEGEIRPGEPAWANYCKGVVSGLVERGVDLPGADVFFVSNVPLGGGLSSSASLEVSTAMALLEAAGAAGTIPHKDLVLICQKAEHEFAGAPCGIMDQSIAVMGQAGRALLLDCRSSEVRQIPFDSPDVVVLVADTQVKHDIADGGYAARRYQCYAAAEKLGLKSLRDAGTEAVAAAEKDGTLAGKELMRARHMIGEIARTIQAAEALENHDYEKFGDLMYASHDSLRDDYEVSCEELDAVVDLARNCGGVYGARMTGGGFGGCAIILAETREAKNVEQTVASGFNDAFGRKCPIFATRAVKGAGKIS